MNPPTALARPDIAGWHVPGRVAYVVNHSYPYSSNGYAVRTHGVARGLLQWGHSVVVINRPGRPWDMPGFAAQNFPLHWDFDGVRYVFLPKASTAAARSDVWFRDAASALEEPLRAFRPGAVLAASNWENAWPALMAARALGLPFHYEVRGLWEVSRLAREPDWESTPEFRHVVEMETKVARESDLVFVLNGPLKAELVRRGVDPAKVHLAPNGYGELPVPANSLTATGDIRRHARHIVGYVGSFGVYEGLDQLVRACAAVHQRGLDVALLMVGSSQPQGMPGSGACAVGEALLSLGRELGLGDRIVVPGRVPPTQLPAYYAAIDLMVLPRKPYQVCEMVTPLKPLEAAAFAKPMLLSDVAPLAEIAAESGAAALFPAGNVSAMADAIASLLSDDRRRAQMGSAARRWVAGARSWAHVLEDLHRNLPKPRSVATPRRLPASAVEPRRWRVATIMDEFTHASFAPECELLQLTPEHVVADLTRFGPDLLFVESAWRGKDELWNRKVSTLSPELRAAISWCRQRRIPTVFWNKEDPVHFETFLTTAQQFDLVFTTDLDCIGRYKAALEHDRVYLLPFACQPKDHNPVELYERKDAFCFAGAYYVRYPERTRDLENYVQELPKFRPLEIFDRNFGKDDPNYQFPPAYHAFIVGTLPFHEIDKAYKGYRYSINLNSVKQSQTMFARRVYELLGCNTVTVSNFSRGLRLMFGDLVLTSDSGAEIVRRLQTLAADTELSGKLRLAGLRKVMTEHTYRQRLAYIAHKALGAPMETPLPPLLVVARAGSADAARRLQDQFAKQTHLRRRLLLVIDGDFETEGPDDPLTRVVRLHGLSEADVRSVALPGAWIAAWSADDHYGPNYLLDLAIATTYSDAAVIGKSARFVAADDGIVLEDEHAAYRAATELPARRSIARAERVLAAADAPSEVAGLADRTWRADEMGVILGVDPYNYCCGGALADEDALRTRVDDLKLDAGLSIDQLLAEAERIQPTPETPADAKQLSGSQLAQFFGTLQHASVHVEVRGNQWHVDSRLPEGKHEYFYARSELRPQEIGTNGALNFHVEATPGLNLQLLVNFLDEKRQKVSHVVLPVNRNHSVPLPPAAATVRLALRVFGPGQASLKTLLWDHRRIDPPVILGRGRTLLLTNQYPAYDDLYRYGFVHTRVKAYLRRGERVDIFRLRDHAATSYHEFEDIDCITGSAQALGEMLASGRYQTVLVHFLDAAMWKVLQKVIDRIRVVVWVHGAEIQPFHRREYNYATDEERAQAQRQSEVRMVFWRELLQPMHPNLQLVFVSRYFAEEVMEDLGFRLPEGQYSVIHNPIDTELFRYEPKSPEQRKKILSIRPFASPKYANDLSVQTILALARCPEFQELEFRLIGDGPLFDSTLAPLRGLRNVTIERGFLQQSRIAELQREYGIFLNPTRWDSQGVSRDEAMAAGLVPVTNAVAAVPEFVDERCGILAPPEDVQAMARGVLKLVRDPGIFLSMSSAAAQRVRRQSSGAQVSARELTLIRGPYAHPLPSTPPIGLAGEPLPLPSLTDAGSESAAPAA